MKAPKKDFDKYQLTDEERYYWYNLWRVANLHEKNAKLLEKEEEEEQEEQEQYEVDWDKLHQQLGEQRDDDSYYPITDTMGVMRKKEFGKEKRKQTESGKEKGKKKKKKKEFGKERLS